jgi:argininosuccinate lyase
MSGPKGARGRRFEGALDPVAAQLNASIDFDQRLLPHDVAGSIAHAEMLAARGLITVADAKLIVDGLRRVEAKLASGELPWDAALEDVHMNVEARLIDDIGDAGRRLHTGRSRNDQVATDLRLYARAAAAQIVVAIDDLRRAFLGQARAHIDTLMPGYTHFQRAQPVRLAHHLLAYDAMLERDRGRVTDAAKRADVSPLGSGALAGTTLPIDREHVARALGFAAVTRNSLDAVGDRDFLVETVAALANCAVHLSRIGEELVIWSSSEFGFVRMSDAFTTGSSMMPQKKNPDMAELVRGKSARVVGDLVALLVLLKGLPLSYNRDLQEDKPPVFDAFDTVDACLDVLAGAIGTATFDAARMRAALREGFLDATEVADWLAERGIPFRDAHHVAGRLVKRALASGRVLAELPLDEWKAEHAAFDDTIFAALDPERIVERRDVHGGPARAQVEARLADLDARLAARRVAEEPK